MVRAGANVYGVLFCLDGSVENQGGEPKLGTAASDWSTLERCMGSLMEDFLRGRAQTASSHGCSNPSTPAKRPTPTHTKATPPKKPHIDINIPKSVQNRYEILHQMGKGQYGAVYKAFDKETQKHVAIKKVTDLFLLGPDDGVRVTLELETMLKADCLPAERANARRGGD